MTKRSFFQGLQGKLLLFFLTMSLVPLLIVSTLSFHRAKTSLQAMGQEMLSDTADGLMRSLDILMNDRQDDIKAWAGLPILSEALEKKDYAGVGKFLATIDKGYDVYKLIMLFDAAGNLVAANDPALLARADVQKNQASHEWFRKAAQGEATIKDVSFSDTAKENVLSFSAPVKGAGGRVIGVLTSRVSWSIVEKILDEEKSGQTGYAYLVNREGIVIAHPKKEKVLKENYLKDQGEELKALAGKMVKGERGIGEYTYEGQRKLVAFTASKGYGDYRGLGWSCAAVQGVDEIYAPVMTLRNIVAAIVVVSIVIVSLIALAIARRIAAPMVAGVSFAQAIAGGTCPGASTSGRRTRWGTWPPPSTP